MSECDRIFTDMLHVPWHGHAKDIHLVGFMGFEPHAWELSRWHTLARQMVFISPNTMQELAADGHWTRRSPMRK